MKSNFSVQDMLWFNFILGLNFTFFCSKLVLIHNHTQEESKLEFKRALSRYFAPL